MTKRGLRHGIWIAVLALVAASCASSTSSLSQEDVKRLAGTWQGTARSWRGSAPMTLQITDQGTFKSTVGSASTQGSVEVRDGRVVLVSPATVTGPALTVTAIPSQRDGAEVLNGAGTSEAGGFSFSVRRQP